MSSATTTTYNRTAAVPVPVMNATLLVSTSAPTAVVASPSHSVSATQQQQLVVAYAVLGSSAMVSGFGAPTDAQQAARLFSAMRMLQCSVDVASSSTTTGASAASLPAVPVSTVNSSSSSATATLEGAIAPMTFPRSLLPMLTVSGSQARGDRGE